MSLTSRLFDSIDAVDVAAWQRVRSQCGEPIATDPRFIAAVEASMGQGYRFWHVMIYDEANLPVACASLSAITYDLADFADPRLAAIVRRLPGVLARLRNLKVLVCGLPGSAGGHTLAIASRSLSRQVLSLLDGVICQLAAAQEMHGIVYQEFLEDDLAWIRPLIDRDYQRIAIPPMHFFTPLFRDLQHYCSALKSRHRKQVKRSIRKLAQTGIEVSVLTERQELVRAYTPEVHDLYCQVVDRADIKPEKLPLAFFHELACRLHGELDLIILSKASRIAAFAWCRHAGSAYHMLFGGFDSTLNRESDLYFNLVYACLDRALRKRVEKIYVGQAANVHKTRLGCYSVPIYVFAKGLGPLMSPIVRFGARWLVAQKAAMPPADIFKSDVLEILKNDAKCTTSLS
jgi:predicted N-acyltransferase